MLSIKSDVKILNLTKYSKNLLLSRGWPTNFLNPVRSCCEYVYDVVFGAVEYGLLLLSRMSFFVVNVMYVKKKGFEMSLKRKDLFL